jgi:hypothetical protein
MLPGNGGADFQSRYDKTTAQAEQMKEGSLRVLLVWYPFKAFALVI